MSIKGLFADFRDYLTMRAEPEIRDFIADTDWSLNQRSLPPKAVAGVKHLDGAEACSTGAEQRLVKGLQSNSDSLHWLQSYSADDFGQNFVDHYGFVELLGTRGHFDSTDLAGGFLLLGPNQHYPRHYHVAEELYIPLTSGSYWMRDGEAFTQRKVGEVIVHASNEAHAMETPATPLLALYLWRNGDLAQKSDY